LEDGTFLLKKRPDDFDFSYHLLLKSEIEKAIEKGELKKYHFNFLRNILEKTATFLGYKNWADLLPKTPDGNSKAYLTRIVNLSSHSKHAGDEIADLTDDDKRIIGYLMKAFNEAYRFKEIQNVKKES
jgi:hypothetical protein